MRDKLIALIKQAKQNAFNASYSDANPYHVIPILDPLDEALKLLTEPVGEAKGETSGGAEDTKRLDWAMRNVSGKAWREIGVIYAGNCDRKSIDEAIDAASREHTSKSPTEVLPLEGKH